MKNHFCPPAAPARHAFVPILVALILGASLPLRAGTLPTGFSESLVAGGILNPTAMEFSPDGRLFVCQQGGQLRVIKNLSLLAAPFVTVATDPFSERGLLGIAFHPGFVTNHFLYVYYTALTSSVHNRVSRFTADGDVAVAGSEVSILDLEALGAGNHNGGAIHFGSDGKLYVAVGENADGSNSQTLANRLGKILRLHPDGSIPSDNPFFTQAAGVNRSIWALGLRNPFTFAVQPGTGRLFINDVGAGEWEEVNDGVAGANYGWPACEGRCGPGQNGFRNPVFQYSHGFGPTNGCAITGGTFYNPVAPQFPPDYRDKYFFADGCGEWIRRLDPDTGSVANFAAGAGGIVDLKVSSEGRLFYCSRNSASVWMVDYTNTPPALGLLQEDTGVALIWPAPSSGFVLQESTSLPPAVSWEPVSVPVTTTNGQKRVFISYDRASCFFRLARE